MDTPNPTPPQVVVVKHEFVGPEGWRYIGRVLDRPWSACMVIAWGGAGLGYFVYSARARQSEELGGLMMGLGAIAIVALFMARSAVTGLLVEAPTAQPAPAQSPAPTEATATPPAASAPAASTPPTQGQ